MSHPLPPKPSASTTANAPTSRPTAPAPPPLTQVSTFIPATLSPNAALLLSGVTLPANPAVVCRVWTGPDDGIDTARRHIVDVAAGAPDIASALAALVRPDAELSLWTFAMVSADAAAPRLAALDFRSLGLKEITPALSRLDLANLHACSSQCDLSPLPCAECTKPRTPTLCPLARTSPRISRAVRRPLRRLYAYWLAALRLLVIERLSHPRLLPTRTGVLVCSPDNPTGEWGKPWLDPARTLTHAHVHISLAHPLPRPSAPSHILVHLYPQSTVLLPFPSTTAPSPGTALLLLPSSTPAYALAPYTGPAPQGFLSLLSGRGVQPSSATSSCILIWLPLPSDSQTNAASPPNINALPTPSATTPASTFVASGSSAKGMYAVWPRALCVIDTATPSIDVTRLPCAPANLIGAGSTPTVPSKPRRFLQKKTTISRPILLSQPQAQQPTSSQTSAQPPSPTTDPTFGTLATNAANLIDTIVRTREKEKEKQRARMERARSGSAVPLPSLSGASTPTTATSAIPPPLNLQIQTYPQTQTQTPTGSALYPSPLANTPHHLSPIQHTHHAITQAGPSTTTTTMSPTRSEGFGIGMDLFGDQETFESDGASVFGVGFSSEPFSSGSGSQGFGMDGGYSTNGPFGGGGEYDTSTTSTIGATSGAGGSDGFQARGFTADLFGDMWSGGVTEDVKSGGTGARITAGAEDEEMGELGDADFDFFGGSWGDTSTLPVPEADVTATDFSSLDLGLDLNLDIPDAATPVIDLDPTSPISSVPTSIPTQTPKPYFPLTPPSEDLDGERKAGMFDPLRFTEKFECVDEKYRGTKGKFVFRLGSELGRTIGTDMGDRRIGRPNAPRIQLPPRSWAYALGSETLVTPGTALSNPMDHLRIQAGGSITEYQAPLSMQVRVQTPLQAQPPFQLHPQFQRQLPTPTQSPNSLRRLRAGYRGLTNPSVKRLQTLRQVHAKPNIGAGTLSVFARDWDSEIRPRSPAATLSEADSDSDSDMSDADGGLSIITGPGTASRGTTPPLSAITSNGSATPPGPALLLAHFRVSVLGSGILGDVLAWPELKEPKTPAPGPVSVPTPVSPGGLADSSKTMVEAAANVLAREAVDNWTWGADIGVCAYDGGYSHTASRAELLLLGTCLAAVGPAITVSSLIAVPKVEMVSEVLTDRPYPHYPRLEKLRQPKIAVGHSGQVVQMNAPVLRFWDNIGLEPVGGAKNVLAFAIFEGGVESDDERVVGMWLEKMGKVYESRKLGKHVLGESGNSGKGAIRVQWDTVTKTLVSLVSSLPPTSNNVVFYVVLPQHVLSAPWFRTFLLEFKSGHMASNENQVVVHLVPASTVFEHNTSPSEGRQRLESTAIALYNRIPRVVGRRVRRQIVPLSFPLEATIQVPAFALARPLAPRFRFSMDWPDRQREVMDRHMFLHVAYGFSKSRRWLCAACSDERGEGYETKVWRVNGVPDEDDEGELDPEPTDRATRMQKYVNLVWHFAMKFAKRAGIEWRVVFCRMGVMGVDELEAWSACTSGNLNDTRLNMHVSVLSVDHMSGLTLASGVPPPNKAQNAPPGMPPSTVIDLAANDYLVLPGFDTAIRTRTSFDLTTEHLSCGLLPLASAHFLRLTDAPITRLHGKPPESKFEDLPASAVSSQVHLLFVAVSQNSSLWKSGGDPWRELLQSFYSLSVLTQARLPSLDPLPIHLAMLTAITNVVENRELVPVDSLSDS